MNYSDGEDTPDIGALAAYNYMSDPSRSTLTEAQIATLAKRTVIIGNSGSGKTMLAQSIGRLFDLSITDLDAIFWEGEGYSQKRDRRTSIQMVKEISNGRRWIVEGVYPWLLEPALDRATALVWTDLNWEDCKGGQIQRGLGRGSEEEFTNNMVYSEGYWTRATGISFSEHRRLFEMFGSTKVRLRTRADVNSLIEQASTAN